MSEDLSVCPLARLCAEAERLILARNAAEKLELRTEVAAERLRAERLVEEATLSLDHVTGRASDFRPASVRGALFSVVLAAADAELLLSVDLERRDDVHARLRRRLYGLRAYLEGAEHVPEAVSAFYMRAQDDPHALLGAT